MKFLGRPFCTRRPAFKSTILSFRAAGLRCERQVGLYVARILKGAKPANVPVQQGTKFEFMLNVKTAKVLGLAVPLLVRGAWHRADRMTASSDRPIGCVGKMSPPFPSHVCPLLSREHTKSTSVAVWVVLPYLWGKGPAHGHAGEYGSNCATGEIKRPRRRLFW